MKPAAFKNRIYFPSSESVAVAGSNIWLIVCSMYAYFTSPWPRSDLCFYRRGLDEVTRIYARGSHFLILLIPQRPSPHREVHFHVISTNLIGLKWQMVVGASTCQYIYAYTTQLYASLYIITLQVLQPPSHYVPAIAETCLRLRLLLVRPASRAHFGVCKSSVPWALVYCTENSIMQVLWCLLCTTLFRGSYADSLSRYFSVFGINIVQGWIYANTNEDKWPMRSLVSGKDSSFWTKAWSIGPRSSFCCEFLTYLQGFHLIT